ncbi:DNA internalization-related competence protein ComEC/Rec2 [candidate division KSB1 bacterium]|nr:DNA internalization-related competence protein ComEC/Rec2 [candidate division KSB1 bacterium]
MHNVPALKVLLPFIGGILLTSIYRMDGQTGLFLFAVLTLLLLTAFLMNKRRLVDALIVLQLTAAGYLLAVYRYQDLSSQTLQYVSESEEWLGLQGTIISPVDFRKDKQTFTLRADTVWLHSTPHAVSGNAKATLYGQAALLQYGDHIVCKARLRLPPPARNPGAFNYRQYLRARGITALATIPDRNHLLVWQHNQGAALLQHIVYPVRRGIRAAVKRYMDSREGALLLGLLLGSRSEIDSDVREDFSDAGVIHVLAVSGLHVGFVVAALFLLFTLVRLPQPWRTLLVLIGLFFYIHLTGCKAPVMRASLMAAVLLTARLLQRPVNIINALALAALAILFINPLDLFQVGFQLSFAAVLGIVLIYNRFQSLFRNRFRKWQERGNHFRLYLSGLFFVSVSAQLATLPLTAFYFGKIPVVSLFANLIVVPVTGIVVALGYISSLVTLFSSFVGQVYACTNELLLKALIAFIHAAAQLPFAFIRVARPSTGMMLLYGLLLFLFVFYQQIKTRKILLAVILLVTNAMLFHGIVSVKPGLYLHFLDVGQGDSIVLQLSRQRNILIDAGDCTEYNDYGERVVVPFLQRNGIDHLDAVIITHPHSDHIGGIPAVLKQCRVDRLIRTPFAYPSPFCRCVDSLAASKQIVCQNVVAGDTLFFGSDVLCLVMHPTPPFVQRANQNPHLLNDASTVIAFYYGRHAFLFAGDAEIESERALMRYGPLLRSDLLKVGHHGSITASSESFIDCVRPGYAVISVGAFNRFGLPSTKRMAMLKDKNIELVRTDMNGAAQFFSDGRHLTRLR